MDDTKEPQAEKGSSDLPTHAPLPSSASSVSDLPVPNTKAEGPPKPFQPTGLVAHLKPLALLTQPKRKLLPRPSSNSLLVSNKAFGIASLALPNSSTSSHRLCNPLSPVSVPAPSPLRSSLPVPTTSNRFCWTSTITSPQKSSPKPSGKSAPVKPVKKLETSLASIFKFRQKKALMTRRLISPAKLKVQRRGRKGTPRKASSAPPPPPPSPPPPQPLNQCHPFELLIANALLELQEPHHHNEVEAADSDPACMPLDLSISNKPSKTPDGETETVVSGQEPEHSDPAQSWAYLSKDHLVPSLVDLFGGEPGIEIPGICVSGIPEVDASDSSSEEDSEEDSEDDSEEDTMIDNTESCMTGENEKVDLLTKLIKEETTACTETAGAEDLNSSHGDTINTINLQDIESPSSATSAPEASCVVPSSGVKKQVVDEQEWMTPLQLGWRRETKIKPGVSRLQAQVTYFTPCGKKLRRYAEVEKYLSTNGINGIRRDHFSFSAKINVGDFYEAREGPKGSEWSQLQGDEIPSRISALECQRGRPRISAPQVAIEATCVVWSDVQAPNAANGLESTLLYPGEVKLLDRLEARAAEKREQSESAKLRQPLGKKDEKRLNQRETDRRLVLEMARELTDPIEDMCLSDHKALPAFSRIPGLILPGRVVLDCLMVMQFTGNFEKVLGLDMSADVPTLGVFQEGLLNVGDSMGRVQDLLVKLLSLAVCDPGLPPSLKTKTMLGEHLTNVAISRDNASEVLQIYLGAHGANTNMVPLAPSLNTKAFQAHTPAQKASILRFMADELACSKTVVGDIDKGLNQLAELRKDRNVIMEKLKDLREMHVTGPSKSAGASVGETQCVGLSSVLKRKRPPENSDDDSGQEDCEDKVGEKGNEEEKKKKQVKKVKDEVDNAISQEELKKQIEELAEQTYKNKKTMFEISHSLRSMMYGQDRYRRRYWVLPHCGGVFIEAMESGEAQEKLDEELLRTAAAAEEVKVKEEPQEIEIDEMSRPLETYTPGLEQQSEPHGSVAALIPIQEIKTEDDEENMNVENESVSPSCSTSEHDATNNPTCIQASASSSSPPVQSEGPGNIPQPSSSAVPLNLSFRIHDQLLCSDYSLPSAAPEASSTPSKSVVLLTIPSASTACGTSNHPTDPVPFQQSALQPQRDGSFLGVSFESWYSSMISPRLLLPSPLPNTAARVKSESHFPFLGKTSSILSPALEIPKSLDYPTPRPIPEEMLTGWWRVSDIEELRALVDSLHSRGIREKELQIQMNKYMEIIPHICTAHTDVIEIDARSQVSVESVRGWCVEEQAMKVDIAVLQQVEALERKVTVACLQVKSCTSPRPQSERKDLVYYEHKLPTDSTPASANGEWWREKREIVRRTDNPLDIAVTLLGVLERNIDRRYLRSPLGTPIQIRLDKVGAVPATAPSTSTDRCENDVSHGMKVWRRALARVCSAAQLAMCIQQLQKSIAWERSAMKVYCQICKRDNNEALLLLCDSCDKGCHTYCHKPKFTTIPDGDWYCSACVTKATCPKKKTTSKSVASRGVGAVKKGEAKKSGKQVGNDELVASRPKSEERGKNERKKLEGSSTAQPAANKEKSTHLNKRANKGRDNNREMRICSVLLAELEKHPDARPFLIPVRFTSAPAYEKVFKKPMDFSTVRLKLVRGGYETLETFLNDINLLFDNCDHLNEDLKLQAQNMRKFFEKRLMELVRQTYQTRSQI